MRALRNLIHLGLVLALLTTGLPLYHSGDANRDDRVDLADAILQIRGLADTADQPASFLDRMEDTLITLSVVAGFGKVIKADRSRSATLVFCGQPGLVEVLEFSEPPSRAVSIIDPGRSYHAPALAPDVPPPRSL